jgi:phosphate transport system permease protein
MKNGSRSVASDSGAALDRLSGAMPDAKARDSLRKVRAIKDVLARYFVSAGGLGVVFALALIFIFLFAELVPIFAPADMDSVSVYQVPGASDEQTLFLDMDRYQVLGVRYGRDGKVDYFSTADGKVVETYALDLPAGSTITSYAQCEPRESLVALGLSDGTALVVRHGFEAQWVGEVRTIIPNLEYPFGKDPVIIDPQGGAITRIGVQKYNDGVAMAGVTDTGRLKLVEVEVAMSFLTGESVAEIEQYDLGPPPNEVLAIGISSNWQNLFMADGSGNLHYYDISRPSESRLVHSLRVVPDSTVAITSMELLLGTVSVVIGRSDGTLSQYFLVRDEQNAYSIAHVRDFDPHPAAITSLATEYTRRGFAAGDASGVVGLHYPTSAKTLLLEPVSDAPITTLAFSPTNKALLIEDARRQLHFEDVFNAHPEVSFQALWGKVWYEGRSEPDYVWQSSSGSDDFESKFSQVPLTLGTLKAAFYAMLMAMPLAVLGAIYAAYFMSSRLRSVVKPSIEVMEALPTVILGFLAGLWLAPFMENNLPAVFSIILLMPVMMILTALLWSKLPSAVKLLVPDGWEAAILVPVLLGLGWVCITLSPFVEIWFFDGSTRQWLTNVGITYDQRNALVVGLAMGFAVIPTIFSIAEDAIFNVPKHLTQGSLALGATPWQTVTRIVLLTASPGIFSAVMIGFGRAVGETMIVLMATGNSPIMNFNIFEGMRTLSANVAVELPETAVGSSHYRILFLAAIVLFALTFLVNTAAEIVRQHLRKKYSSL